MSIEYIPPRESQYIVKIHYSHYINVYVLDDWNCDLNPDIAETLNKVSIKFETDRGDFGEGDPVLTAWFSSMELAQNFQNYMDLHYKKN